MNKDDFIAQLIKALEGFVVHPFLTDELIGELKRSGKESRFLRLLLTRLKFLRDMGKRAIEHKEFEPLENGICSIHLTNEFFNLRILYGFLPDHTPALLLAFYERAGHNSTDYTGKISVAEKRLQELEELNESSSNK